MFLRSIHILYFYLSITTSLNLSCSVAFGIAAATPELLAGVDALFRHAFYHGFSADGTGGGIGLHTLFLTIGQTLSSETFHKSSFHPECIQLVLNLATNHQYQTVTKHQQTIGYYERIIAVKPLVELMFLGKDMDTALMLHIIFIVRFVKANTADSNMLRTVYRPGYTLLAQEPIE